MSRILEAGHYYRVKGPTRWSQLGWEVLRRIRSDGDRTMLFIDDVHDEDQLHEVELCAPTVETFDPVADFRVLESRMNGEADEVFNRLGELSSKGRPKKLRDGSWHCSGTMIRHANGDPTCALLDAGLALWKFQQGFRRGVNILPEHYYWQQQYVLRLVMKAVPDFDLSVVLFDQSGQHQVMEPRQRKHDWRRKPG